MKRYWSVFPLLSHFSLFLSLTPFLFIAFGSLSSLSLSLSIILSFSFSEFIEKRHFKWLLMRKKGMEQMLVQVHMSLCRCVCVHCFGLFFLMSQILALLNFACFTLFSLPSFLVFHHNVKAKNTYTKTQKINERARMPLMQSRFWEPVCVRIWTDGIRRCCCWWKHTRDSHREFKVTFHSPPSARFCTVL